ncbi:hypothetical protein AVEN_81912-1 [Araneus ventricosus]|uniref:Uncharacterized protein n=2 Tax=Araneus ventricosus TaxID=182803 RepID=A0A4Y1ZNP7_ARAVE|nr:hypothetical protein AVEN_81912-1 [Araneus ventricosus]
MTTMATGLACLPRYKMVAVATTAADIRFFSASTYNHKQAITPSCHSIRVQHDDFIGHFGPRKIAPLPASHKTTRDLPGYNPSSEMCP